MNGYDDDYPIGPHTHLDLFRRCPFDGDSDSDSSDSEAFRVESTGIFMLSLPDSLEEKDDSTSPLYQTAPEELLAADAVDVEVNVKYVDDGKAVDLGRDTDVGLYSEVQSTTETVEKDQSIQIIGVRRSPSSQSTISGLPFDESVVSLGESSSKKLRLSEEALGRTVVDKFPPYSSDYGGGSKVVPASSVCLHNNGDEDSGGKCKLKRMDDGKDSNGEIHCNYKEKSAEKEVKERVKNSQSHEQNKLQEEIDNPHHPSSSRVLPPSISGLKKNAAGTESHTSEVHPMEVTILKILKILKGEEKESKIDDEALSKLSILDIVQRRGMTFPRPQWWPPGAPNCWR